MGVLQLPIVHRKSLPGHEVQHWVEDDRLVIALGREMTRQEEDREIAKIVRSRSRRIAIPVLLSLHAHQAHVGIRRHRGRAVSAAAAAVAVATSTALVVHARNMGDDTTVADRPGMAATAHPGPSRGNGSPVPPQPRPGPGHVSPHPSPPSGSPVPRGTQEPPEGSASAPDVQVDDGDARPVPELDPSFSGLSTPTGDLPELLPTPDATPTCRLRVRVIHLIEVKRCR